MRDRWIAPALILMLAAILVGLTRSEAAKSQAADGPDSARVYTDDTFGYSLGYPAGWQVSTVFENTGDEPYLIRRRVALHDPQGTLIEIDVWDKDPDLPMEQWYAEVEGITTTLESNAIVGGQKAFVFVQRGGCGVPTVLATYIPHQDRVFKIHSQQTGDARGLQAYEEVLRSFSLADVEITAERQTALPDLGVLLPLACGTNLCPSTCSSGCTFAPSSQGCCGYHPIPRWQCSRECLGSAIGDFLGNCVWWGAYTRRDVGALASGDASNWAISVRNTGQLPIDRTPKVGDIVVHPGSSYNHVAYVVWVSPDGSSYKMSDMGWCADCGPEPEEAKLRTVDANDEFIHCKGDPAIPTVDWQFRDCPFGWTPSKGFAASELDGSGWKLDPAQDPYLLSPLLSVPADEYHSLEITMASFAADGQASVSFTTAITPSFDVTKTLPFTLTHDGGWHKYTVRMSDHAQWQGTITRLRIDPADSGNGDGSFDYIGFARIRFLNFEPTPPAAWVYLPLALRDAGPLPPNRPPYPPAEPFPPDGAVGQPVTVTLSWLGGDPDGDAVTYDVYLGAGDESTPTLICGEVLTPTCAPGTLISGTQYAWQVTARDEYSATTQGPVWAFSTVVSGCSEGLANGGFELDGDWELPDTPIPAVYTTTQVHGGSRSMQVGLVDSAANIQAGYSSARQLVSLPAGSISATLGYWLYPLSGEAAGDDAQYVLILNESGQQLERLLWQRRDDRDWTYHEADLSGYAGQTIKLHFGVVNDGEGGVTGMYVDDVSLWVCLP